MGEQRSNPATTENLQKHQKVTAVVELIKDDYLVLSLLDQGNAICFASTGDYNLQVKDAHQRYQPGQRLPATVEELAEEGPGGRILLLLGSFTDPVVTTVGPNKRARHERKMEVGSLVDAEVLSVEQLHLILNIGRNGKGRVHITEVKDEFENGNPLSSFVVGQNVKAKVLVKPRKKRTASRAGVGDHLFELSLRPSQLTDVCEGEQAKSLPSFATLAIGQAVTTYVQEVTDERAWLLVAPHVRGRLFVLDSSTDPTELQSFKERFTIGTAVHCCVKAIDHSKGTVDFTLVATDNNFNKAEIDFPQIEGQDPSSEDSDGKRGEIKEGEIVGGRISRLYPGVGGLSVQIAPSLFGRVHITHMSDTWRDNPVTHFREGQFVRCVVLEVKKSVVGKPQIDLSLRSSLGGSEGSQATHCGPGETEIPRGNAILAVNTIQDLKEGLLVKVLI
jgi:rRNA biogenesis protein RRP5